MAEETTSGPEQTALRKKVPKKVLKTARDRAKEQKSMLDKIFYENKGYGEEKYD